jgi:phage-related holin
MGLKVPCFSYFFSVLVAYMIADYLSQVFNDMWISERELLDIVLNCDIHIIIYTHSHIRMYIIY